MDIGTVAVVEVVVVVSLAFGALHTSCWGDHGVTCRESEPTMSQPTNNQLCMCTRRRWDAKCACVHGELIAVADSCQLESRWLFATSVVLHCENSVLKPCGFPAE